MATATLKQFIKHGERLLPLPNKMNYEQAIEHYSTQFPELTNAVKEEQYHKDGKHIIEVKTAIGQKG